MIFLERGDFCLKDEISYIILSHGHDDYTGGLLSFLKERGKDIDIYAHPDIFTEKYKDRAEIKEYIGIPKKRETYEKLGGKFILRSEFFEIGDGIYFSGKIKRINNFLDETLIVKRENRFTIDPLNFENRIEDAIEGIKKFNVKEIYPLHCTGTYGKCRLISEFGEKVKIVKTGSKIEL